MGIAALRRPARGFLALGLSLALAIGVGACGRTAPDPTQVGLPSLQGAVLRHVRAIYLRGAGLGQRADVFAKVGDSNTANGAFLRDVGCGHLVTGRHSSLLPTVAYFSRRRLPSGYIPFLFARPVRCPPNSFVRIGFAAHPGWAVSSLLRPFAVLRGFLTFAHGRILPGAHPGPGRTVVPVEKPPQGRCAPALSAVACELEAVRPATALVMIGTNDVPALQPASFASRLREVIGELTRRGCIPVLSTIPPLQTPGLTPRVLEINRIITTIAAQDELPLWDLHRALEQPGLINHGLSADGTHLSRFAASPAAFTARGLRYGMNLRNLQALEILDQLRRLVLSGPG